MKNSIIKREKIAKFFIYKKFWIGGDLISYLKCRETQNNIY